jgi:5-methylcytosine-specific restriction endonuclease McrA
VRNSFSFSGPVVAALGMWGFVLHGPLLVLLLLELLFCAVWPAAFFMLPYSVALCWPRTARASYRNRRDRHGVLRRSRAEQRSQYIPVWLRRCVYAADRNCCVYCGQPGSVALDHHVPWSWGGLTLGPNLFVLCERHNLIKLSYWIDRHGVAHGRTSDPVLAAAIFFAETRARRNPVRWFRMVWAIG